MKFTILQFLLTDFPAFCSVKSKIGEVEGPVEPLQTEVLYPREMIRKRVVELAADISRDYKGRELIVIGILKGAFVFMADLIRCLSIPCRVDFVRLASYGSGATSSGKVAMTKDVEIPIKDQDILLIEDVVDTGLTLSFLVNCLRERNPRSLKVCALLDKPKRRQVPFEADYVGFVVDDGFVVGYGIDFNEKARFLPNICVIKE